MEIVDNVYLLVSKETGRILLEFENVKGHKKKALFKSEKELYKAFRNTKKFDRLFRQNKRHYGKSCGEFKQDLAQLGYGIKKVEGGKYD